MQTENIRETVEKRFLQEDGEFSKHTYFRGSPRAHYSTTIPSEGSDRFMQRQQINALCISTGTSLIPAEGKQENACVLVDYQPPRSWLSN